MSFPLFIFENRVYILTTICRVLIILLAYPLWFKHKYCLVVKSIELSLMSKIYAIFD